MSVIKTEDLCRSFDDLEAVRGLSFSVNEGEIFGLVGPDGAGKTTTLRMLSTTLDPTGGQAHVLGMHTVREAEDIKQEIGYMSQRFGLYTDLSVLENLHFYADLFGLTRDEREKRIDDLLSRMDLTTFGDRAAGKLSGGMKQKLYLSCTLLHRPRLLFLDEPTFGVDPVSRREFWHILNELVNGGLTVVVTTAYMDEAERCTRVGFMDQGALLALGTPKELKGRLDTPLLEVRTTRARDARKQLENRLPPGSVLLFGDRLHVRTPDPDGTEKTLRKTFEQHDIPLSSTRVIEPTLEDVLLFELNEGAEPT